MQEKQGSQNQSIQISARQNSRDKILKASWPCYLTSSFSAFVQRGCWMVSLSMTKNQTRMLKASTLCLKACLESRRGISLSMLEGMKMDLLQLKSSLLQSTSQEWIQSLGTLEKIKLMISKAFSWQNNSTCTKVVRESTSFISFSPIALFCSRQSKIYRSYALCLCFISFSRATAWYIFRQRMNIPLLISKRQSSWFRLLKYCLNAFLNRACRSASSLPFCPWLIPSLKFLTKKVPQDTSIASKYLFQSLLKPSLEESISIQH